MTLRSLAKEKQTGRYALSEEDSLTPAVHQTFFAASASASLPFFHGFSLKYSIGVLVSGLTAAGAARSLCGERACRSWSESVKREAVWSSTQRRSCVPHDGLRIVRLEVAAKRLVARLDDKRDECGTHGHEDMFPRAKVLHQDGVKGHPCPRRICSAPCLAPRTKLRERRTGREREGKDLSRPRQFRRRDMLREFRRRDWRRHDGLAGWLAWELHLGRALYGVKRRQEGQVDETLAG